MTTFTRNDLEAILDLACIAETKNNRETFQSVVIEGKKAVATNEQVLAVRSLESDNKGYFPKESLKSIKLLLKNKETRGVKVFGFDESGEFKGYGVVLTFKQNNINFPPYEHLFEQSLENNISSIRLDFELLSLAHKALGYTPEGLVIHLGAKDYLPIVIAKDEFNKAVVMTMVK